MNSTLQAALSDRFIRNSTQVRKLAAPIHAEQFWEKPFPFGNSFGHLVLHLTGNLNYYIGTQIAKTGYVRDRPREFNDPNPPSKEDALKRFDEAVAMVLQTIAVQSSEDWSAAYSAVGVDFTNRLEMFLQCAAHIQHHAGQMIYLGYAWSNH